jgi:pimeloyl-ACP methyl ester carboxylesterase
VDIGQGQLQVSLPQRNWGPTVIFESGIAATSQNWSSLQESVTSFTNTLSYDRGGLGWSTECDTDLTPANIVRELRMLLSRAGVAPPYVRNQFMEYQ